MIDALQELTASLPAVLQWLGVLVVSAIPFVESYFGSVIGILAGIHPFIAVALAVVGNVLSMLVFVATAHKVRSKVTANRTVKEISPRQEKLRARLERYGVPGVSLLSQLLLPSQFTASALISFGAAKNTVILWQIISITVWGVAFAVLGTLGVTLIQ